MLTNVLLCLLIVLAAINIIVSLVALGEQRAGLDEVAQLRAIVIAWLEDE